jgi:predicted O-linked N-acetylglucosamine transferase (SPINDLY family)
MLENVFSSALQKAQAAALPIGELVETAIGLASQGEPKLARDLYRGWLAANPDNPQRFVAHFNCSALDSELGETDAAAKELNAAITVNPDFVPAYINLGGILERAGNVNSALEHWNMAARRPRPVSGLAVSYTATALRQIARVLSDHHRSEDAEAAIRLCLEIDPSQEDMIEQLLAMRLAQCKWPVIEPLDRLDRDTLVRSIHPLSLGVYTDDPLFHLGATERYSRERDFDPKEKTPFDRRNAPVDATGRRLRIGYVSSDLRDHAIGYLMSELFELHDRSKVEVFAYYCGPQSTMPLHARIKAAVEHWTDISKLSDDHAAKKIAEDGIDILVDVNGHTRDARTAVFARRPAPIQVNWLGYPGTMATPYHHYIIADEWIIPPGSEFYYTERVARLPCYQPNDRKRVIAEQRPTRAGAGLPDDAFVFCCFNGTHKISRFTFDRWLQILSRVPRGVLWLLDTAETTKQRLGDYAEKHGVSRSRIFYAPKLQNAHHLARYPLADLFLDTVPYGAHTTASDSLWMGVPVLTLSGRGFASRVCGSLVRSAGLPDLVVSRPEDFVERAVELGNNPSAIQALKAQLEASRSSCVLFDTNLLARHLEALYRGMALEYARGGMPQPNITGLSHYLDAGVEHDHEAEEVLAIADYHGAYKARLARRHQVRPIAPDGRLWTAADIAAADAPAQAPAAAPAAPAAPEDPEAAIARRIALVLHERSDLHPLIRLRDVHDVASTILCRPLTIKSVQQLAALLAIAKTISVPSEPGSDMAAWEKHYRVMLNAIDLNAMLTPLPDETPDAKLSFVTSGGKPLDWAGVRATADRLGARAIFFAAADESYMEQYARFYALSVLKYCDVPFLIVTHVIGGAARLKQVARTVGIDDERLIFAGDDFDAAAVVTACFDAPPKGKSERPIAQYQSARFQRLGQLLKQLQRPVFVSDIDLLLQRGVADLLEQHAGADIVLNENEHSEAAGSRLTANLLLVNPTENGRLFARFLKTYLDRVFEGPECSRWVDQLTLTLARHHVRVRGHEAKFGYFDTTSDINNVMYRSYQEHPFRFLSLFHGFDTATLEPEAPALQPAPVAKAAVPPAAKPASKPAPAKQAKPPKQPKKASRSSAVAKTSRGKPPAAKARRKR